MINMYYNIKDLCKAYKEGKKLKYIFFWSHRPKRMGIIDQSCFSQWWKSSFTVENIKYQSAEHWMMAEKAKLFNDEKMFKKIINASSPAFAKKLGSQIEKFDEKTWDKHKFDIVIKGNFYKFSQNKSLKEYLINTGQRVLAEASPIDKIWGIGLSKDNKNIENPLLWEGKNLLGFAIMKAREQIIRGI